ncbi:bifunctional diguanylate cyclase/phosphodiesterase [Pseudoduganella namucuonensis]|uniref:PAS domain S-box-containing protein/diguanylate cyclase (GGDEF) domain-containing protein n=1 Tax=Pseudoduganella namucuonensis TaxID=1035707 RepID=A0A1I7GWH2_9BURK|nr:EAL domain-containing protein [Pseudoduganella namucuonensis]SFU52772.1 PAS domain S-box-containing protein/diguanylate cyclase (GGDEF) domain-containing protein [Pseudoduganella namucuonensis]
MDAGARERGESARARWLRMGLETHVALPLFAALLLAAIWAFTLHFIALERQAAGAAAADSVRELADTYEAQVVRNLGAIDQSLRVMAYAVERKGAAGALTELNQHGLLPPGLVFAVAIADAHGRVVARNPAAGPASVARRPYFLHHQRNKGAATMAGPARSDEASGEARIDFSRRLEDEEGGFAGVVAIAVEPAYFTSGYERRRQGEAGVLALVGNDGMVRALRVGEKVMWGRRIDLARDGGAPAASSWDGVSRYTVARPLHGFPLTALAGLSEREQLAMFEQRRRASLWEAGVASAAVVLMAALLWYWIWQAAKVRRRIRRAQETYAAASEANMDAFFALRGVRDRYGVVTDFKITAVNSRAERLTGLGRHQLQSMTLCGWLPHARGNGIFETLAHITRVGGVHEEELRNSMPQFHADWLHWQVVGVDGGVVAIVRDISERKQAEERIVHMAHHDTLTGLPNRSLVADRLRQAILHGERNNRAVAVAFIDLDGFKLINDGLGHNAGDALLKEVAARMVGCVRRHDTVGRFGGDEFVLVLPEQQAGDGDRPLALLLDKLREAVIRPVALEGQPVQVSCSIGVAVYPRDGGDADTLLMNADAAMYRAKETGKNNCQFYAHEMNASLEHKLALMEGLRTALAERQFRLLYQPKVDVETGRVFGVEALLRWHHPQRGVVGPDQFIPLAEESGAIVDIGEWVLLTACRQARAWRDAGLAPVTISVNVSARQFDEARLVQRVQRALERSGLEPEWLELEVTESLVMRDLRESVEKMRALERMGIALAIDDFGTGYSSLAALKSFPISCLKIDQSFVRDLDSSADDQAIARAIISLSHQLQLRVIAEGVETGAQRDFLLRNGCREMQGYLFGRPLPPEEIQRLLEGQATVPA